MSEVKKKIGIIVQRYGAMVNGGAETHARMIAEKLAVKYDVTVLTSRALDYHTWVPELPEGESFENGIRIIRFDHPPKGSRKLLHLFNRKIRGRHLKQKLFRLLGEPKWFSFLFPQVKVTEKDYLNWLELQGPAMKGLPEYLIANKPAYSAFIFMTYLYYPTAIGVQCVPEKSILIPTMHDEPPAYFEVFQKVMSAPAWIFFNTKAEQDFSELLFNIESNNKAIVAVGIDAVEERLDVTVKNKFGINKPYIVYVGRIDLAKGCDELLHYFQKLINENKIDIELVLVGKNMMEDKTYPSTIFTGFVTEEEKQQLMKQAAALIIPSKYESLSLVLLESFACKVPVIANGECQVLKDHIELSNGGWVYNCYDDFKKICSTLLTDSEDIEIKRKLGFEYVTKNYTWEKVMSKFDDAIEDIENN